MAARLMREWLASGALDLPLPAGGDTRQRWQRLADLTAVDVTAGRLAEAHADAAAILTELSGAPPAAGQWWGVWAAEAPDAVVTARYDDGGRVLLDGVKAWCSGAALCTHALVTARVDSDERGLFAVDLAEQEVTPLPTTWQNAGMAESDTRPVRFDAAPAIAVGKPGEYLSRPGFWHGAVGVAACWLGGARAVAAPLYRRVAEREDPHAAAHLGAVDAALAAAEATLAAVAADYDADPLDHNGSAELLARRARAVVESAVDETLTRTGRALGPGPLAQDAEHARRVADLAIYIRQSHAERDLARLGSLAAGT
jgi:alkylation response protein AidB-like acyl-CoA dehydrogenase